ncbi:MAG: DNA polymerase I [Clostridia bacterium]|nr:DNA polymerase I [Clostridia bacterium]
MNRAFYGIMGSKMMSTKDGTYTNAVYGFLSILFKLQEDLKPEYLVVAFDLKAPTARHKMYAGYKANRHGMPDELREQMPIIKDILRAMNIDIVEMEGYEADDVLGTLSCYGEKQGLEVSILSGDRDTFQLATDKVTIRIPRTKSGKTETELYNRDEIKKVYGLEPKQLIDVKGLQGDSSDNIPGVPGIGEKTALSLIQKYGSIEKLYEAIEKNEDDLKGKQREKIAENKELAVLSKTLGTINLEVPITDSLEDFKVEEWDKQKVYDLFKKLNFNRYIEKFGLIEGISNSSNEQKQDALNDFEIEEVSLKKMIELLKNQQEMIYYIGTKNDDDLGKIIKEKIISISVFNNNEKNNKDENIDSNNVVYYLKLNNDNDLLQLKPIFENEKIRKIGINLSRDYILLKQSQINLNGIFYDVQVAGYILNPTDNKISIKKLSQDYANFDIDEYLLKNGAKEKEEKQINLFDSITSNSLVVENNKNENAKNNEDSNLIIDLKKTENCAYVYAISKIKENTEQKLQEINAMDLFTNIDMPTVEVLSDMQWNGMYADEQELTAFGEELKENIDKLTKDIYELAGEEFNINSTKQLGTILFEKMKLPVIKKTKSGYSTDVDVLEKLRREDPIISKLLDYRQLMKLNSTYVEGLKPYINPKTKRIHSFFHQTITATGRISSTEPNLQNIPTRFELGKRVRKIFKPAENCVYIDSDYSQIELRVLAHISGDKHMIEAFQNNEDIHKQAASKVFKTPIDEVTKEQRSNAKAVNFGIVYGISDYGLSEQLGISVKKAKQYIEEYLEQYSGIKEFMINITESAKEKGYVETLFHRRRYIPELKSNNYMVRQFGSRAAMNTPIQGTAADIMKIAMINVFKEIKKRNLKSKIVLQVHDEMMIEAPTCEVEEVKQIVKEQMQSAIALKVPLIAEISEADNWYECK